MKNRATQRILLFTVLVGMLPVGARAQAWSVDLSAGRIVYDPLSVNVGTNNLVGTVRYDALREAWVYGSAAAPIGGQAPFWSGLGGGGRFVPSGWARPHVTFGADIATHGFFFRDRVVSQSGSGAILEAMPFTRASAGLAHIELRGGWRGQTLAYSGVTRNRSVFETGGRASYDAGVHLEADARVVYAAEGTFPFLGATVRYDGSPVDVWAQTGKWMSDQLSEASWGVGIGVALTTRASLWASVQKEAPDPLYWNAPRRSWSVGVTHRLGDAPGSAQPAGTARAGDVVIRIAAGELPDGDVSIAGSFNRWQPVPMVREGRDWVIHLPLAAGVYEYAFRSGNGGWFVPASVASRRDDGMGGQLAILVVL